MIWIDVRINFKIPFTLWIKRKENSGQLTDNIPIVK